ncbi:DEAD/DEAH box helicase [Gulosibacter chungangensis]|uniref:DEAD/DEAH box helicase n=1 Tax=Gulosibacter chungangensis TaxID=979746 RepID=A0A7J5BF07_9MICO|nr:DEAD/DEAH box helicase [Gulosibacter chungangensis]KAB1644847.1 DEAD/DEAH box helicase [Gulosibacter chungangensis]
MTSTSFAELGVPADLVAVLAAADKTSAFPIQQATLPSTLAGRDVLGRGKTGSGKTLAFSIPLVTRVAELKRASGEGRRPKGLVLLPTRELATQVANVITPLAAARRLSVATVFGGVKQGPQERAFRQGVDILVACPGRLDDLMKQGIADLRDVEVTVLDEADHMADLGFLPVVTRILNATPTGRQRLLFSATLDNGIDKLVKRYLRNPIVHSVDEANSPVAAMTHHVYEVASTAEKTKLVRTLASGTGRRILFMRTKHQAKKLARQLTAAGIPAVDLHGNLSQNARDRNLAAFSSGEVRVLVATDVAARGVHVDGIELVVHVDPPAEHKAYLHRSGRTARAGAEGDVVTIMLPEQRQDTKQLLRRAQISVAPRPANFQSDFVLELVGEQAPHVAPVPGGPGVGNEPKQQPAGTSNGANARRKRAARAQRGQGAGGGGGQGGRAQGARSQGARSQGADVRSQEGRTSQGARGGRSQSSRQPRQNASR